MQKMVLIRRILLLSFIVGSVTVWLGSTAVLLLAKITLPCEHSENKKTERTLRIDYDMAASVLFEEYRPQITYGEPKTVGSAYQKNFTLVWLWRIAKRTF